MHFLKDQMKTIEMSIKKLSFLFDIVLNRMPIRVVVFVLTVIEQQLTQ